MLVYNIAILSVETIEVQTIVKLRKSDIDI